MEINEIKILHITNVMDIGGVQKIIYQICEKTVDSFDKIVVLSSGGEYADKLVKIGVEHIVIPDLSSKNIRDITFIVKTLKNVIKKYEINVIHCHHRMAVLYAKLCSKNIKIVYNNHTIYSDKKILTHIVLKHTNIIADGVRAKANLTEYFELPDNNITVINNAVDDDDNVYNEITIIQEERKKNKFIVMNCSRLHPQKAVNYFIEAADILVKKGLNISFFIVGDGPQRKELEEEVNRRGLYDSIFFLGFRDDIKNTIKNADLLVQTSIYEGLPLTPMEAFSVRRAVVGTDIEGTREVIENGVNGLLAESKNSESIAEKIEQLYYNRDLLKKMDEQAYYTYVNYFSMNSTIKKYIEFYKQL